MNISHCFAQHERNRSPVEEAIFDSELEIIEVDGASTIMELSAELLRTEPFFGMFVEMLGWARAWELRQWSVGEGDITDAYAFEKIIEFSRTSFHIDHGRMMSCVIVCGAAQVDAYQAVYNSGDYCSDMLLECVEELLDKNQYNSEDYRTQWSEDTMEALASGGY